MAGSARSVGGEAGEEAAVLHHRPADVDVADDLAVHGDVLAHHVPAHQHTQSDLLVQYLANDLTSSIS